MQESTYIPEGRLSNYVKFIWCNENYTPESSTERVLPSGSSQLIINLDNKKFRHFSNDKSHEYLYDPLILTGVRANHIFLDSHTRISTIGIVLKPGAITAFFQIPASEFQSQVVSLGDVLNRDVSEIREQLAATSSHQEKFVLIESFLLNLLDPEHELHPAVQFTIEQINKQNGSISVSQVLSKIGYSRRWFSQLFRETVGIPPKQFSRIQRFQKNLSLIREKNPPDWAQLAVSNGYFDQPHFIHDFKDLAGISPSEYKKHSGPSANHLSV